MAKSAELDQLNHDLQGEGVPARGFTGRTLSIDEKSLKALPLKTLQERQKQWEDGAKAVSEIPRWQGAQIGSIKKSVPEFDDAGGRDIAKAVAYDYGVLQQVSEAAKKGTYKEFEGPGGTRERGIVAQKDGKQVRDGQWVQLDSEARIRQIASFKEGVPHGAFIDYQENGHKESSRYFKDGVPSGTAYKYNEKGEVVHRTKFGEAGKILSEEDVDPVVAAAQKQERQQAIRAIGAIKIGR